MSSLPPCWTPPVPIASTTDPPQDTAESICQADSSSVKTHLGKMRKLLEEETRGKNKVNNRTWSGFSMAELVTPSKGLRALDKLRLAQGPPEGTAAHGGPMLAQKRQVRRKKQQTETITP